DGEADLVLRRAGARRGRAALRRRHLVDGVVAGAAVLLAEGDLAGGVAVAAARERHAGGRRRVDHAGDLAGDLAVHRDAGGVAERHAVAAADRATARRRRRHGGDRAVGAVAAVGLRGRGVVGLLEDPLGVGRGLLLAS